jgi:hypothetical protein
LRIVPNIWHSCELELAKREAKQLQEELDAPAEETEFK